MKIKRSDLGRIVREEFVRHILALREAPDVEAADEQPDEDPSKAKKGKPEAPPKAQASSGKKAKDASKGKAPEAPKAPKKGPELPPSEEDPSAEMPVPDGEDPADDQLDDEMPEDPGAEGSGGLADEIVGKTVQALTIEPKSKLLPGAKEIVVAFKEVTDTLKILITSTGTVKFFYRGKLSDMP